MTKTSITLAAIAAIGLFTIVPTCSRYTNDAGNAIFSELSPTQLNRKYEWFKDAHSKLASLQAQVDFKKELVAEIKAETSGRAKTRDELQLAGQYSQELQGITAAYNNLAAEYNSEMSKFHTAFLNAGTMPKGSELPREVISYK